MTNDLKPERQIVQDLVTRSEDEFEKKLTYISAGALLLSATFLEKIVTLEDSSSLWILISGWSFLVMTLIINLFSHLVSKYYMRKNIDDIDDNIEFSSRLSNHQRRLKRIESMNWISAIFLIIGVVALVVFTSINAISTSNNKFKEMTLRIQKQ